MTENPFLLQQFGSRCRIAFREHKVPFLSAWITGLLCYMYAFTNKLPNHDDVSSLFSKGGTVSSGRWGLGALDAIFPNYSMPWIYGILTIALMALAVCVMVRILSIRNSCLQALLSGSVLAFPSLIGTFTYMFTTSSFALSFLCAVLAVWFLRQKGRIWPLVALGLMIFSLSIYQSYIALAAGLLVVVLIRDIFREESLKKLILRGVGYVLFLALSLGLYYLATQVILVIKDVSLNDYASEKLGFSLAGIPAAIVTAYRRFFLFFTEHHQGLIPTTLSKWMHLLGLVSAGILLVFRLLRKIPRGHAVLLLALLGLLPLAINCMYLFTGADAVHTLVLYGFVTLYALWAVIAQEAMEVMSPPVAAAENLLSLAMAVAIVVNIYVANAVWLNMHLRYENAFAFYTTLVSDLQQMPEFQPGCKLALVGNHQQPDHFTDQFAFTRNITGSAGFTPDCYSREQFLAYYIGMTIPMVSQEEAQALAEHPQVRQMPVYPYHGSVAAIDGTIVVRLS